MSLVPDALDCLARCLFGGDRIRTRKFLASLCDTTVLVGAEQHAFYKRLNEFGCLHQRVGSSASETGDRPRMHMLVIDGENTQRPWGEHAYDRERFVTSFAEFLAGDELRGAFDQVCSVPAQIARGFLFYQHSARERAFPLRHWFVERFLRPDCADYALWTQYHDGPRDFLRLPQFFEMTYMMREFQDSTPSAMPRAVLARVNQAHDAQFRVDDSPHVTVHVMDFSLPRLILTFFIFFIHEMMLHQYDVHTLVPIADSIERARSLFELCVMMYGNWARTMDVEAIAAKLPRSTLLLVAATAEKMRAFTCLLSAKKQEVVVSGAGAGDESLDRIIQLYRRTFEFDGLCRSQNAVRHAIINEQCTRSELCVRYVQAREVVFSHTVRQLTLTIQAAQLRLIDEWLRALPDDGRPELLLATELELTAERRARLADMDARFCVWRLPYWVKVDRLVWSLNYYRRTFPLVLPGDRVDAVVGSDYLGPYLMMSRRVKDRLQMAMLADALTSTTFEKEVAMHHAVVKLYVRAQEQFVAPPPPPLAHRAISLPRVPAPAPSLLLSSLPANNDNNDHYPPGRRRQPVQLDGDDDYDDDAEMIVAASSGGGSDDYSYASLASSSLSSSMASAHGSASMPDADALADADAAVSVVVTVLSHWLLIPQANSATSAAISFVGVPSTNDPTFIWMRRLHGVADMLFGFLSSGEPRAVDLGVYCTRLNAMRAFLRFHDIHYMRADIMRDLICQLRLRGNSILMPFALHLAEVLHNILDDPDCACNDRTPADVAATTNITVPAKNKKRGRPTVQCHVNRMLAPVLGRCSLAVCTGANLEYVTDPVRMSADNPFRSPTLTDEARTTLINSWLYNYVLSSNNVAVLQHLAVADELSPSSYAKPLYRCREEMIACWPAADHFVLRSLSLLQSSSSSSSSSSASSSSSTSCHPPPPPAHPVRPVRSMRALMDLLQQLERYVSLPHMTPAEKRDSDSQLNAEDRAVVSALEDYYETAPRMANSVPVSTCFDKTLGQIVIVAYDEALALVDLMPPAKLGKNAGVSTAMLSRVEPDDSALSAMGVDMVSILLPQLDTTLCTQAPDPPIVMSAIDRHIAAQKVSPVPLPHQHQHHHHHHHHYHHQEQSQRPALVSGPPQRYGINF